MAGRTHHSCGVGGQNRSDGFGLEVERVHATREQVQRVLHIEPAYTIDTARKLLTMRDEAHLERILQSLRMAVVPQQ